MKKIIILILILYFSIVYGNKTPSQSEQRTLIKKITVQEIKKRNKYRFITFTRKTHMKIYDYKKNKLLDVIESTVKITRNLKTKKKKTTVIFFKKNGKVQPKDKYKEGKETKFIDVFSPEGLKEYTLKFDGYKKIGKVKTYVIKIIPKRITAQHLKGTMYYDIKTMELIALEGRPAKYSFPLKKLYSFVRLKNKGGISITKSSYMVMYIHVPFVFSHRKMVLSMTMYGHKLTP